MNKPNKTTPLKGYGQMYRSGITMKQKWATDRQIAADRKAENTKPIPMGKNE
jgi:hypothetical protein